MKIILFAVLENILFDFSWEEPRSVHATRVQTPTNSESGTATLPALCIFLLNDQLLRYQEDFVYSNRFGFFQRVLRSLPVLYKPVGLQATLGPLKIEAISKLFEVKSNFIVPNEQSSRYECKMYLLRSFISHVPGSPRFRCNADWNIHGLIFSKYSILYMVQ